MPTNPNLILNNKSGVKPENQGGNTGNEGDNTGNTGGNTGNEGDNTGNTGGNTGNEGDNTGNTGENTGNEGDNTGNTGGNAGNTGGNTGNTGNTGGNTGNTGGNIGNTGNTGGNAGNTGGNTGNTGNTGGNTGNTGGNIGNTGNTGGNAGNTGGNTGNTGNTGGNTGNTGANIGNTGNTGGNVGNAGGNIGNTGNTGANAGNAGGNTGNTGNTGGNAGNTGGNTGNTGNTGNLIDNGTLSTNQDKEYIQTWNERPLNDSIKQVPSNNQQIPITDKAIDDKLFSINEDVFQKTKEQVGGVDYLMEANLETLKKKVLQTLATNLITDVSVSLVKGIDVINDIKGNDKIGVLVNDGINDICVIYKDAKTKETMDLKSIINNAVQSTINNSDIKNIIKNTILTYVLSEMSKTAYLKASSYENNNLSKDNEINILKTLRISAAFNALAANCSKDQVKYYKQMQLLNDSGPLASAIYNTLELTNKYTEKLGQKINLFYKETIDPKIDKIAKDILGELLRGIFDKVNGQVSNETTAFSYTNLVKNSISEINIEDLTNKILGGSNKKSTMEKLAELISKNMEIISNDPNVKFINTQIGMVNSL